MSDGVVQSTLRLTIQGPAGGVDLAVPMWAEINTALQSYVAESGATEPLSLVTIAGKPVDLSSTVQRLDLRHGDVLVAVPAQPGGRHSARVREPRTLQQRGMPTLANRIATALPFVAVVSALLAAATSTLESLGSAVGPICAAVFLLLAVVIPLLSDSDSVDLRAWVLSSPGFAVAAVLAATADGRPGGVLLTTGAMGLAAAASAAYTRAMVAEVADEELLVWLYAGAGVAVVAAGGLLLATSNAAVWALLLIAAIAVSRLLPSKVVDVPDHVLLDFQRLAITAWSAREKPRRPRRGIVRRDDVAEVAHRGRSLVGAGAVASAVIGVAGAGLLLLAVETTTETIGARVMVVAAGISFCLGARAFRARVPRTMMRIAGALILVLALGMLIVDGGPSVQPAVAAAATFVGILVAFVAMVLGRGWQSVWWARIGEIVDTLSVVAAVACIPLATGFFDVIRQMTSS